MRLHIRDRREFWAGATFLALGGFVLVYGNAYPMGTATDMGPGYFPRLLAIILVLLGVVAVVNSVRAHTDVSVGALPLVPLAFVTLGVLMFAAMIDSTGLIPAVIVLSALSCYARLARRPLEFVVLCAVVLLLAVGIFFYGIQIPLHLWRGLPG
jgi:hypothetical protein